MRRESAAVIQSRRVAAKHGFLMYYTVRNEVLNNTPPFGQKLQGCVDMHPEGVEVHFAGAKLHSTGCLVTP